jgi:hypothetical protein
LFTTATQPKTTIKGGTMANLLKNKDYDLISIIYNASQAAEICNKYMQDAQQEGDKDIEQFFEQVRETNANLVQRGTELLKNRLH